MTNVFDPCGYRDPAGVACRYACGHEGWHSWTHELVRTPPSDPMDPTTGILAYSLRCIRLDCLAQNLAVVGAMCKAWHLGEVYGYITKLVQDTSYPNLSWVPNLDGAAAP